MADGRAVDGRAVDAWRNLCAELERSGVQALEEILSDDEIDVAEGLRHLSRMARLTLAGAMENNDSLHPYLDRSLGPTLKMGGDNPCGLYLSAPVNGTDTFRLTGTRGSATWLSFLSQRSHECFAHGLGVFGDALFSTDLHVGPDGTFEIVLAPEEPAGGAANWIQTDRFSARLMIRQFFGDWDDVRPMDLSIENVTSGGTAKQTMTLDAAVGGLARAAGSFSMFLPAMQSEMRAKGETPNAFATDIGDPTSNYGGVPGGNAVTARWRLEPHEALVVRVTPPTPCPYWDVQVGNVWYESWDYRHFFSGLCCTQAAADPDGSGSVTLVVSDRDPGVANWLEAAGHRTGHIAIRWQLTEGRLPIPECSVVAVDDVPSLTGLPHVSPGERREQRRRQRAAVEARFRP